MKTLLLTIIGFLFLGNDAFFYGIDSNLLDFITTFPYQRGCDKPYFMDGQG